MEIIECQADRNEIEKYKLHINEIDTITSILLKLSGRLAKIENDLLLLSDNDQANKVSGYCWLKHFFFEDQKNYFERFHYLQATLMERREQAQQKHDEAKALKDGIDRRSRLVTNILQKYLTIEQFEDYEHYIRMKSTLSMDAKDIEEHLVRIEKQIQMLMKISSSGMSVHKEQRYSTSMSDFQNFHASNHRDNLSTNSFKSISSTA